MDIHPHCPPGPNSLQSPEKPSEGHAASVESIYQGRQVAEYQEKSPSLKEEKPSIGTRAWSSIKSIPREISIFCRAVGKVSLIVYYLVKHRLYGVDFTSQDFKSYLTRLGPAYPKVLQMVVANPELLEKLGKELNTTECERARFDGVVRDIMDNNPEIPMSVPKSILEKAGCKDHSVVRHIATGTVGSCFEVKKDEETLLVKVVPDSKANDLEAGLKSIRMLLRFMPKDMRMTLREMTDPFIQECNLKQEKNNQSVFKETLEKTEQTVKLNNLWLPHETTLTFKVPKVNEAVDADNLLIMEYLQDGHTLNTLMNRENQQLRSEVFQKCYGTDLDHDFKRQRLLTRIHTMVKTKWRELALEHGIVHGDCHPGNIMLTFKPGGLIDVWFIDFGNCVTLTEAQRTKYPDVVRQLSNLSNPFVPEANDQKGIDQLVDTLWDEVAISHRDNTPKNKEKFKNSLIDEFNEFRDLDKAVDRIARQKSLTLAQKVQLREQLRRNPDVQTQVKNQIISWISARLSSLCKLQGIQLPSSFTRYINAHFRVGVIPGEELSSS